MGFFGKKEDKRLPDLPTPRNAGLSVNDDEKHALPSFPDSPTSNRFSEAAIKDAVSSNHDQDTLTEVPQDEKEIKVVEMDEWKPSSGMDRGETEEHEKFMPPEEVPASQRIKPMALAERHIKIPRIEPRVEIRASSPRIAPMNIHKPKSSAKEVFVKIDKYYTARKAITEIAEKLEDINEMVKKIREVKLREEQELAAWERDIMQARTRVQEINQNLFDKTE